MICAFSPLLPLAPSTPFDATLCRRPVIRHQAVLSLTSFLYNFFSHFIVLFGFTLDLLFVVGSRGFGGRKRLTLTPRIGRTNNPACPACPIIFFAVVSTTLLLARSPYPRPTRFYSFYFIFYLSYLYFFSFSRSSLVLLRAFPAAASTRLWIADSGCVA